MSPPATIPAATAVKTESYRVAGTSRPNLEEVSGLKLFKRRLQGRRQVVQRPTRLLFTHQRNYCRFCQERYPEQEQRRW